jgi:hypothetical protein
MDVMRDIVNRNLLKYAAGTAVTCRGCDDIMDAARTVVVTSPSRTWVGCARCWGRGPFCWDAGDWSVLDGRVIFATITRTRRPRRRAA